MTHARQFSHDPAETLINSLLTTFEKENASADRDMLMHTTGLEKNGVNIIASATSLVEFKLSTARKELDGWKRVAENSDDFTGVRHDFDKNEISYEKPDDMIDRQLTALNTQIYRLSEILSLLKTKHYLLTTPPSKDEITEMAEQLYQFLYQSCCKELENKDEDAKRALCLKELSQLDYAHDLFTVCQKKIDESIQGHLLRENYEHQKKTDKYSHAHLMIDHYDPRQGIGILLQKEGRRYYKMADDLKAAMPTPRAQINDPALQRSNKI